MPRKKKYKPIDIVKISFCEDPKWLRVEFVAATENSFEVYIPDKKDGYSSLMLDICRCVPYLLRLDMDLMEMYDDAGRTKPNQLDINMSRGLAGRYTFRAVDCALPGFDSMY